MRFAASVGLVVLASSAAAQPVPVGQEGPLAELVPPIHGRKACFARTYDAAHLRAHPAQRVQAMALGVDYHRHQPDKTFPDGQRNYYFTLSATVKGERKQLVSSGECKTSGGRISCAMDCDGGGFGLEREPAGSVKLDMTTYGRLRMSRGCDDSETDTLELRPGADDRTFRLQLAPLGACRF